MTDTPKLWRNMTPEEKGALLLAHHEGKAIEWYCNHEVKGEWLEWEDCDYDCLWDGAHCGVGFAYRVKPEPKRETVTSKLCITSEGTSYHMMPDFYWGYYDLYHFYFTLTFDLIDGKPDLASIKIEEL